MCDKSESVKAYNSSAKEQSVEAYSLRYENNALREKREQLFQQLIVVQQAIDALNKVRNL